MAAKVYSFILIALIASAILLVSSCRKDNELSQPSNESIALKADTTQLFNSTSSTQYLLARAGKLQLSVNDTVYTFDARSDSIVFIYMHQNDTSAFFGITAINKAHTLSFGISSAGILRSNISSKVAGSQLLVKSSENNPTIEYALSSLKSQNSPGSINFKRVSQSNGIAIGIFSTFLTLNNKSNTTEYKVNGTFNIGFK